MDPVNYGSGHYSGAPVYYNQSSIPHRSMYQATSPYASQAPVCLYSDSFPMRANSLYQPPPVQPGRLPLQHHAPMPIAGHYQAVPYPHIHRQPQPAQVQPQTYTSPPPQQFMVHTQPSNLMYQTSPPPPSLLSLTLRPPPPAGVMKERSNSLTSFSSANSELASTVYKFSGKSEAPMGTSTGTSVPPYLKDEHGPSASKRTCSTFLQAAFQHGIRVENPKRKMIDTSYSAAPFKENTTPFNPFSIGGFDKVNRDGSDVIEKQQLVDYYVNKHENLGQKLKDKNMRDQNENTENKIVGNINNNAEPFVNEDKNNSVLHWLSKSEGLEISNDGIDYMKKDFEQTVNMTADTHSELSTQENLDKAFRSEEGLKHEKKTLKACWYETEEKANKTDSLFDDSTDIIEDHEFLQDNLKISAVEYDSTFSGFEESAGYDEVNREVNTYTNKVDLVKDNDICECAENCHANQMICGININQQPVEINTGSVSGESGIKEELEFSMSQALEENDIHKYQQQLQEAESSQIEILTTSSKLLEQIASKIVKRAVARGVLKFFSTVEGTYADFERDFTGTASAAIPVENKEEIENTANSLGKTKEMYTLTDAFATSCCDTSKILHEGPSAYVKQENGHVYKTEEYANGSETERNIAKRDTQQTDEFEKFFFKQTAARHGITIKSPDKELSCQKLSKKNVEVESSKDTETAKLQDQNSSYKHVNMHVDKYFEKVTQSNKSHCKQGEKLTEEIDSKVASFEGSHNDSGEAFRIKASQRGILVNDPASEVEISTDSDAELELLSLKGEYRGKKSEQAHRRNASTPDAFALILNLDSPEFKAERKKQTFASRLRADAAEFNPGSLSSSFSLNTSFSESEASEKLDTSLRVDAPEFMPAKLTTCSKLKPDAASFKTIITQSCKEDVISISKLQDKKSNQKSNQSVEIQASPDLRTVCVGTNIKTKETCSLTGSCETRDVAINTEVNADVDCKYVTVKKLANKASNTDKSQKSVAINVRMKIPNRPATSSVMTMTEASPLKMEKCFNCDPSETDLEERLMKQDILLQSMGKLQIELMFFKEKEIREKIIGMKESLMKKMTGIIGLFTDSDETSVLQSMIQNKLTLLEDALAQVKSVTSTTVSQIQSGTVLDQLPDFGSILHGISKSPNEHVICPERETVSYMPDMGPEQGTKTKPSITLEPAGRPAKIQRSVLKECTSLEHIPCRSQSGTTVSEETSANISQRKTRTKGFMEIEDSSDEEGEDSSDGEGEDSSDGEGEDSSDEEGVHECKVISKVNDFEEADDEAGSKQKVKEAPDIWEKISLTAENKITENLKPENTSELESRGSTVKVNMIIDKEEMSDLKILTSSSAEDKQYSSELENANISDNCGLKFKKEGDVNKQTTDDTAGAPNARAIFRLISEKMSAEYGNESVQTLSNLNAVHHYEVNNDSKNENSKTYGINPDAIDSDDNEMGKSDDLVDIITKSDSKENENDVSEKPEAKLSEKNGGTIDDDVQRPSEALKGTAVFGKGYSDYDSGNDATVVSATKSPIGLCGSEINIDPKEVFISQPNESELGTLLSQHSDNIQEPTKSAVAELPANGTTVVDNSIVGISNMPMMLGNMDPSLYQAVLAQLIQAYPGLASNQEMLTQVAIQQTGLLQMYVGNRSGSGQQMFGIGSGELRYMTGNPNMMEFGQEILKLDQMPKQSTRTLQNKDAAMNNSSKTPPGIGVSHLNSACKSEIPTCEQMNMDMKASKSLTLNPVSDSSAHESKYKSKSYPYSKEDTDKWYGRYNNSTSTDVENDINRKKEAVQAYKMDEVEVVKAKKTNEVKKSTSSLDDKVKLREISSGLDDNFHLITYNGARPKSLNKSNNAFSEKMKLSTNTSPNIQADFLPDFAKHHKQENTSTRVVHHFVTKVSDTVSRAIANSDEVHFKRKTPSPVQAMNQVECKAEEANFPHLQKSGHTWPDFSWSKNTNKNKTAQKPADTANSERMQTKTQKSYLPPWLYKQACTSSKSSVQNQDMKPQEENWEDEVDNYAQTFTLHHDVYKPITLPTQKNKEVDFTKEFPAPVSGKAPDVDPSTSMAGLCDIPMPISTEIKDTENADVEDWQKVQSKRKHHYSKEPKKKLRQYTAPFLNTAPVNGGKQVKKNNYERLVARMELAFPQANKEDISHAINKIREERGTLSGLSMEAILEKAHSYIKPAKNKIPGLWADKKQPYQTPNITSSSAPLQSSRSASLQNMELPTRKPASVGLLKLDIPPRKQHLYAGTESCTNTFKEDICVICHDPLTEEPVKELECMHVFHSQCISQWMKTERTCPTCRKHTLFPEEFPRLER